MSRNTAVAIAIGVVALVLGYPCGRWLGGLTHEDVPQQHGGAR